MRTLLLQAPNNGGWLYLGGGVALFLLLLIGTLVLYIRVVRRLLRHPDLLGYTLPQRLLNLAVTGAIFRGTAYLLFFAPVRFLIDLSERFRQAIIPILADFTAQHTITDGGRPEYTLYSAQLSELNRFASQFLNADSLFFMLLAAALLLLLVRATNKIILG